MESSQKKIVETRKPFNESLFGIFFDTFNRAGVTVPIERHGQFEGIIRKMANLIASETKLIVLKELGELQKRMHSAVAQVGEHLTSHEDQITELKKKVDMLSQLRGNDGQ